MTYALPGPIDRIDRGDRLGAVRERRDGLGAADRVHLVRRRARAPRRGSRRTGSASRRRSRRTPATSAGTAVITSEDGRGERPLGTQQPDRVERRASGARRRSPEPLPRACRAGAAPALNSRTASIIRRSAARTSSSTTAASIAPGSTRSPSGRGPSSRSVHSSSAASPRVAHVRDDRRDGRPAPRRGARPSRHEPLDRQHEDRRAPPPP